MSGKECHRCGAEIADEFLSYRCNYCNERVCTDHRLPEKHDCPGLVYRKQSASKPDRRRTRGTKTPPKPTFSGSNDTVESDTSVPSDTRPSLPRGRRAPGKTPDDWGAKGPDVNPDGSIRTEPNTEPEEPAAESVAGWFGITTRRRLVFVLLAVSLCLVVGVWTGTVPV